ncbi:T9SS type A sorting domain-containing protein [Hymenobacter humi]|uniref:T9SS type A sorting domain-containing protein n=1 Tax=Hymenobacter humi TaxID=1411620 RepID=A0ABW2UB42_9BACT
MYSIDNAAPAGTDVRLGDGFSPAEKFLTLSSGTTKASAGLGSGTDVSQVVGARLAKLAPGDSTVVTFAMMSASSLAQLQAAAEAASIAYATLLPTRAAAKAAGFNVFPNPTNGPLQLELPAQFGLRQVQVINTMGQVVLQQAGSSLVSLNLAGLAAGLYTVRAQGSAGVLTRAVVVR